MDRIRKTYQKYFTTQHPLPSETHQYQSPPDSDQPFRLHLRIEPDGSGLLIVNAKTVMHLNPTAAEYAYYLIKDTPPEEAAKQMARRYRVARDTALNDYIDLSERLRTLMATPDLDPEVYLEHERLDPYTTELSAPFRLDCALTYRLPMGEDAADAPEERVTRELTTDEWKMVLDKSWQVGIPHVVFTGGEPTLREDLPELIAYTQQIGQVSGLLTDGLRFAEPDYLQAILQTGLDHVLYVLHPENDESWKALQALLSADIHVTVHLTLTHENAGQMDTALDRLSGMDEHTLSLSAMDPSLAAELQATRNHAAEKHLSLVWDLPVPYSDMHPVALEEGEAAPYSLENKGASGAGVAWLYVEPDGDVLPGQGINQVLGNILTDPWEKIWQARKTTGAATG